MKLFLILSLIALLFVGCASKDTRLEGRWKSNKALTVATIDGWKPPSGKPLTLRRRALLASLFGKLIVTYRNGAVTCEMPSPNGQPPYRNTSYYRVVASDKGSLVYVSKSPLTGEPEINHVYFEGPNRYWIYLHRTGMREFFDRVAE